LIEQAARGGPIWVDVGNAALDHDCYVEALDLKGHTVVEVLFSCALEILVA